MRGELLVLDARAVQLSILVLDLSLALHELSAERLELDGLRGELLVLDVRVVELSISVLDLSLALHELSAERLELDGLRGELLVPGSEFLFPLGDHRHIGEIRTFHLGPNGVEMIRVHVRAVGGRQEDLVGVLHPVDDVRVLAQRLEVDCVMPLPRREERVDRRGGVLRVARPGERKVGGDLVDDRSPVGEHVLVRDDAPRVRAGRVLGLEVVTKPEE